MCQRDSLYHRSQPLAGFRCRCTDGTQQRHSQKLQSRVKIQQLRFHQLASHPAAEATQLIHHLPVLVHSACTHSKESQSMEKLIQTLPRKCQKYHKLTQPGKAR